MATEGDKEYAKVSQPNRQLTVGTDAVVKHQAVAGAVHRLKRKSFLLNVKLEHVVGIMLPMSRCLPQLTAVNVRGPNLRETAQSVLLSNEANKGIVNAGTMRQKKTTPGA